MRSLLPKISLRTVRTTGSTAAMQHEDSLRRNRNAAASARSENRGLLERALSRPWQPLAQAAADGLNSAFWGRIEPRFVDRLS